MKKQKGQVLLITVLVLMSTFALAVVIGGLVLYDLRAMISAGESTKAIYGAESCIEWELYKLNKGNVSSPEMSNDVEYREAIVREGSISCSGNSGRVSRAFQINF
jgi:hypothetical protein